MRSTSGLGTVNVTSPRVRSLRRCCVLLSLELVVVPAVFIDCNREFVRKLLDVDKGVKGAVNGAIVDIVSGNRGGGNGRV